MLFLRKLKEQHIVLLALGCFVLVSAGLISLLFSRESQHNRLSMQYQAAQIAFTLMERYTRVGFLDTEFRRTHADRRDPRADPFQAKGVGDHVRAGQLNRQ